MNRPVLSRWLAALAVMFAISAMPLSAMAISYTVSVDTSTLAGADAVVAFQFNPAPGVDSPSATATVADFAGASASDVSETVGGVTGGLFPGPLVLENSPSLNYFLQPLTLGASFSFSLSFTDNVPPGNDGSYFGLSLVDADNLPLLPSDPDGVLLAIDLFPGQTPELTNLSPTFVTIAVIPEPGTYALMLAGVLMLAGCVRRLGFQSNRRLDNSSLRYA